MWKSTEQTPRNHIDLLWKSTFEVSKTLRVVTHKSTRLLPNMPGATIFCSQDPNVSAETGMRPIIGTGSLVGLG